MNSEVAPELPGNTFIELLINEARTWLGTPYRFGGSDRTGTDCSGFIMQVYKAAMGVMLPRTSEKQKEFCQELDKGDLTAGDLIFFTSNSSLDKTAHVGMYIGDGIMIHASSSKGVIESSIESEYYRNHYISSGRIPNMHRRINTNKDEIPPTDIKEVENQGPNNPSSVVRNAFNIKSH